MSWCEDIKEAMNSQPERVWWHLSQIYSAVEEIQQNNQKPSIDNFESAVRNTLEKNSRGIGKDIFEPKELGSGWWRLENKKQLNRI